MVSVSMGVVIGPLARSCALVAIVGERAHIIIVPKDLMGVCENSSSQRRRAKGETKSFR